MHPPTFYPIGVPGQPWGAAELEQWRARQRRQRSHQDDVVRVLQGWASALDIWRYGDVLYPGVHHELWAVRLRGAPQGAPRVLLTGGVHGYETSGVHGALRFLEQHAQAYAGRLDLVVVPCVSPWAYEHVHRWNFDAIDPNRSFRHPSPAQESAALIGLVQALGQPFTAHIDLHETTDTDESEYRPAVAARDGKPFVPGTIPDGFYLVDDADNPQPDFQQAILAAVRQVTHIAPADTRGEIIGTPMVAPGVIHYPVKDWGLCTSVTGARYTTITEVYPDSPATSPQQCVEAQVAAVRAALDFVLAHS